jgi:hypothetical protein
MFNRVLTRLKRLEQKKVEPLVICLKICGKGEELPPPKTSVGVDGRLITVIHDYCDWA